MKFSENWLREFCNPDIASEELVHQLTMAGLEVDSVAPVAATPDLVVVGEVIAVEPHPDADRLVVCRVSTGSDEHQVVCGAPNAKPGLKAPFAQIGAQLPDMKVGKAKLRGVESQGMLCSEKELLISDDHEGLMELPSDAPVGENLVSYLQLNDTIIDLDLTPNRSDCLSLAGLAREVGVLCGLDLQGLDVEPVSAVIDDTFPVASKDAGACPRFVGRVLRGINPQAESPLWMKEKLRRSGIRSLGPVVDVTNLVMLELGQPLHAYDLAKLSKKITVRQSKAGEKVTLLDGKELTLNADTLLITDASGPIGLAGIMGGLSTAVSDTTVDIFLESAFFAPQAIAGRARSYNMATDAAHRFERGVDWQGQAAAMERATALLLEIAGGQAGPVVDTHDAKQLPASPTLELRASRIKLLLGVEIDDARVEDILARLGFTAARKSPSSSSGVWRVTSPSHRFDISLEADLIEEISRIFGYDNLPSRTPTTSLAMLPTPEGRLPLDRIKARLVARGYFEAITYSFVDADLQRHLDPSNEPISLTNPLSSEMSVMRTTLWGGLLKSLAYNLHRQQSRVRLFETGLAFARPPNQPGEVTLANISQTEKLAGVACGPRQEDSWANDKDGLDFFDIKGDLEAILALTGQADSFEFAAGQHPALHPGQCAEIKQGDATVGYLGLLDPRIQQRLDLRQAVFLFELNLDPIADRRLVQTSPLSRFPEVRRDLALIVERQVSAAQIQACIRAAADDTLKNLILFDQYQGEGIEPDRKSLALGLTFQHASRTLRDEEINASVDSIVAALKATHGVSLRN